MRGEIAYKILSFLEEKVITAGDLVGVFISSGYGASIGKIEYEFNKKALKRIDNQINRDKIRKIRKYLYKLEKEGFISKNSSEKINLTSKGKRKLDYFKNSFSFNNKYKKEDSDKVIIISYDIPIAFNKERNILRDILRMLGFNIVHKSVWVGKVKLPKEFIIDLEKLGILDYIEILEVTKSGSLKSQN